MGMFDFLSGIIRTKEDDDRKTTVINQIIVQDKPRGTSGTQVFAGYYDEEYLDTLKGKDRAKQFDKMRRASSQVKMLISAVKNPIRTSTKEIHPGSEDEEHKKHAELCRQVLFKDIKFNKFLNEALTMIEFGHSVFEKVHKINVDKPITDDDGILILNTYVGLKKLAWRNPKTIETWDFNAEKDFIGITQQADGDLDSYNRMEKEFLMIMTVDQEGDDYEGVSLLRPCYGNYFRQNEYFKLNAIGIEKSMPIPTAEVPVGKENSPQFDNLINSLERFTTHQKNYLTYPQGWSVNLSNGTNYDPDKVEKSIDNEDKRMAKAFLANFLELAMSGTSGSYAMSNDLSDFFLTGLIYIANIIKEEIDELLKELVILNFGVQDKYPCFEFSGIDDKAGEEFAKILEMFVRNKIIIPDERLEEHVRKRINVTPISEDGQREVGGSNMPIDNSGGMEELSLSERVNFAIRERRKRMID